MKVTLKIGDLFVLAKDTPYYYEGNKSYFDPNDIQTITYPAVVRIRSMQKLRSGLSRINFSWFLDEMDKLVDASKYLIICPDLLSYTLGLGEASIAESLVSKYVISLNDKLRAATKKLDDFHLQMLLLREELSAINYRIDKHVKVHEELRDKLPDELLTLCEAAAYDHKEFISYNNEMVDFLSGDTAN